MTERTAGATRTPPMRPGPALRVLAVGLVSTAALAACLDPPEDRDLGISVEAMRSSVPAGDSVDIQVEAEGPRLLQVEVTFGDGRAESIAGGGSVEVTARLTHAYDSVGTYNVVGLVEDLEGVQQTDNTSVEVVEP